MGVYQLHSEDEGQGRVYKQRHDDNGSFQSYLYRSEMHTNIHSRTDSILLLKWAILVNYSTAQCTPLLQGWPELVCEQGDWTIGWDLFEGRCRELVPDNPTTQRLAVQGNWNNEVERRP